MACAQDPQLELVTCSLCFELYNESDMLPKGLPCMHTFCLDCLRKYVQSKMDFQMLCPLCQSKFVVPKEGVEAIPTNFVIRQLRQQIPTTNKQKEVVQSESVCDIHKKEGCAFACETCHVLLCEECVVGLSAGIHAEHTIGKLPTVIEMLRKEYDDAAKRLGEIIQRNAREDAMEKAEKCRHEAIETVEKRADKMITEIIEWKNDVANNISSNYATCERNEMVRRISKTKRLVT